MKIKAIAGAVCLALMSTAPSFAATLNFDFSFTDGTYVVEGQVNGLTDNAISSATSVIVDSNTANFGVGTYAGPFDRNIFEVVDGAITSFDFAVTSSPLASLLFFSSEKPAFILFNPNTSTNGGATGIFAFGEPTFTPVDVPAVPLPAGILFMLTGLLGFAGLQRIGKNRSVSGENTVDGRLAFSS